MKEEVNMKFNYDSGFRIPYQSYFQPFDLAAPD